jgi:hypothetical protein
MKVDVLLFLVKTCLAIRTVIMCCCVLLILFFSGDY